MNQMIFGRIKRIAVGDDMLEYGVAGAHDAPALLLLHAIRNTKLLFAGIMPALAEKYRVIAVDLRGHGQSSVAEPYTFEQITRDLMCVLEAEKLDQVTILAASFSAVPAQMLAVREPQRISSLILLDGGYYCLEEVPGFDLKSVVSRLAGTRFASVEDAEHQFAQRYDAKWMPTGWMQDELQHMADGRYGYRLPKAAFAAYFQEYAAHSTEQLFKQITCPVLLLLADEKLLPDEEQKRFYREAAHSYQRAVPQVIVKTIPDSQHLLMVTNPQETLNEINRFLHK
ncbi:3-oxoadipate enol-lactonase [Brevibacillus reuszeri]|uniref:3-oxoadipate enol-lactonase n=1 Tax=Brevibacillus reuszeri TaxID=54915 RepID=A0A0K9YSW7_9BACL|nr:alpha/beta hydrolase [Brevibacillus reuszeri]KNB71742.1 alpha/beta hydrolase [Brevibacillus reuszeri]MED1855433.1 alpha/beta hydrolase [Brevibacillus reuszeri]GED67419.1 3-oxoadipate enol-lactonase [Brevibacillus reuszeri]